MLINIRKECIIDINITRVHQNPFQTTLFYNNETSDSFSTKHK